MEQLQKEADVEIWDDADFDGIDNVQFRNASSTTTTTAKPKHRESTGSRKSIKSDDDDGDWQLLLANDDETSTRNAIENAKKRGIPLPANVPPSALLGGTIKKLGARKSRKAIGDDWAEDLELPAPGGLKLKIGDAKDFPDTLRNISGGNSTTSSPSPAKPMLSFAERLEAVRVAAARPAASAKTLDRSKDDFDDFFDDVPTIKVAKARVSGKIPDFTPPTQLKTNFKEPETFENDFELPKSGQLKLSTRSHTPKTPGSQIDDLDQEWPEGGHGSLGSVNTSFSGIRRAGKSARSSSISARSPSVFSPSLSSCLTAESEDEGLDGLILPNGPLNFGDALQKRRDNASPELVEPSKLQFDSPTKDDFLDGLDIGSGPVFDASKLTLNRNIKQRPIRQMSPPRRSEKTLTFTNKPVTVTTRIPKPAIGAERSRSKLEPVAESGGPISHYRSTASRIGSHSQQSSVSSLPTPSGAANPSIPMPSTPSRRLIARSSRDILRPESAQNKELKNKRSLPAMSSINRVPASPARVQPPFQRPTSRQDRPLRTVYIPRPRTPVDRSESSAAAARRPSAYGTSSNAANQPRQLSKQGSRTFHRPTSSDSANDNGQAGRPSSRLSMVQRSGTPSNPRGLPSKHQLVRAATAKKVTEPVRRRGYGDGTELDAFDDLPTSFNNEAKFTKQPAAAVKANANRRPLSGISQASAAQIARSEAPSRLALSPTKSDNNVPSFARSTAASRLAREQRIGGISSVQAQRHPQVAEPQPQVNWKTIVNNKPINSPRHPKRAVVSGEPVRKPQLINRVGAPITKGGHGMHWNEQLFRWEGNESALAPFDIPSSPKRNLNNASPVTKPALIANFGTTKGVQVVGGMVFDPERMMWVKMSAITRSHPARHRSDSLTNTTTTDDAAIFDLDLANSFSEEDDPFAGIADLADENTPSSKPAHKRHGTSGIKSTLTSPRSSSAFGASSSDEESTQQAEEFDVGPSFVKRQLAEEEKWRRRLKGWNPILLEAKQDIVAQRNCLRDLIMRREL